MMLTQIIDNEGSDIMSQSKLYTVNCGSVTEAYNLAAEQFAVAKTSTNCFSVAWLPSSVTKALRCEFGVYYITKPNGLQAGMTVTVIYCVKKSQSNEQLNEQVGEANDS